MREVLRNVMSSVQASCLRPSPLFSPSTRRALPWFPNRYPGDQFNYLALNQAQSSWKSKKEDITLWLRYFLEIVRAQATQAFAIIEGDRIEHLLSEKQLALWQWAQSRTAAEFSRKDAIEVLQFPARTVEAISKRLLDLKKLERMGSGRGTRYRISN